MERSSTHKDTLAARRTYALLRNGLFRQLAERPFEQISLTDICTASLISRSTFYRYFEDKYDLLRYCLTTLLEELGLSDKVMYFTDRDSIREFLTILFRHIDEHRAIYQSIYTANKDSELIPIIRDGIIEILTGKIQIAEGNGYHLQIAVPIYTILLTDFYIGIVKCYFELDGHFDLQTFVDHTCRFINRDFFEKA
ncbi:MAG: TetR/AcrR family transcriptional regulator [Clostridiales bacterium]|nr:TetR/AcrR family transcriptional regulator [Clostridiales bacterium]